eukprot:UN13224
MRKTDILFIFNLNLRVDMHGIPLQIGINMVPDIVILIPNLQKL